MKYRLKYPRTSDGWITRWRNVTNWCNETIGIGNWDWDHISEEFIFKNDQDRILFLLRWR